MNWVILSIITAFCYSMLGILTRKLSEKTETSVITWTTFLLSAPFVFPVYLLSEKPAIDPVPFIGTLLIVVALNMLGYTIFVRSLKITPISLSYPFLAFSPVFLLLNGFLILGEKPGIFGAGGVILICSGVYILNLYGRNDEIKWFTPFVNLMNDKGSLLMLLVAFIWSFAAAYDKKCVIMSGPVAYVFIFSIAFSFLYPFFMDKRNIKKTFRSIKSNRVLFIALGLNSSVMHIAQMYAINTAKVAYVISIKRSGILFAIAGAYLFLNEKLTFRKVLGAFIIVAGAVIITLFD